MINIYCDGACRGNPGESGSGVIVYLDDEEINSYYGHFDKEGTNNTAELKAFIEALKIVEILNEKCIIFADSQYCINSITNWAYKWKSNNWTKKGGIKNLELIKTAHELYDKLKNLIEVKYVKGHSNNKGNDKADYLANKAIDLKEENFIMENN